MKKRINGKLCDTETAQKLGTKYVGEFGQPDGYEEQLFMTNRKNHFLYGNGGPTSKYTAPTINLITDEEAEAWKKENKIKSGKAAPAKTKKKPTAKGTRKKAAKPQEMPKIPETPETEE